MSMSENPWDALTEKTRIQYLKECVNGAIKESGSDYHFHHRHSLCCRKLKSLAHIDRYEIQHLKHNYIIFHDGKKFIEITDNGQRIWWLLTKNL